MRHTRPTKQAHRALFLALQADAKEYPGGIKAIAEAMGVNGNTLANALNPDHENQPPSFAVILEIVAVAQAKRAVFALAQLVGQVPMDMELQPRSQPEAVRTFLSLVCSSSKTFCTGSEAAKDGRFDAIERKELEPLVLEMMQVCAELLQSIRA